MNLRCSLGPVLLVTVLLCCGCNPDWPEQSGTAVVHGSVWFDGSPLPQANIVFVPLSLRSSDGKLMPLAYGTTDSEGKFELEYSDGPKEIREGKYTVMISKVKQADPDDNAQPPWQSALLPDSVSNLITFSEQGELVPEMYNRNSNLTYQIIASPSIVKPKFELTSIDPELIKLNAIDPTSK